MFFFEKGGSTGFEWFRPALSTTETNWEAINIQAYGNIFTYSQIELKTGIMYEHRINDYLIGTFQGGLQNFISNRATEKGEPTQNFIYENKQDVAGYFQIGISIDPFAKKKN